MINEKTKISTKNRFNIKIPTNSDLHIKYDRKIDKLGIIFLFDSKSWIIWDKRLKKKEKNSYRSYNWKNYIVKYIII